MGKPFVQYQRDELLAACKDLLAWLNEVYPPDVFTGESGEPGPVRVAFLRARANRAIALAEAGPPTIQATIDDLPSFAA